MPDRLTPRVLAVCDAVGDFIEAWGFRAIHGRTWTYLALRREPVPQTEIADALGVSRSLIHLAISELAEYGLVRPVGTERNAPYEASMDVWPTITDVLRSREWMLIERARLALEALLQEAESKEETPYDVSRIRILLAMAEVAQTGLKAILGIRVPQSFEAFGKWLERSRGFFKRFQQWFG
jgi:DNA-binding transcriptional regulator GbsR (MarR family)